MTCSQLVPTILLGALLGLSNAARAAAPGSDTAGSAVLHLANGDSIAGELLPAEQPRSLRWQSPPFTRPFDFALGLVNAVHYRPPAKLPAPDGEYCFELASGDMIFGKLAGLTKDDLEVDSPRFGSLRIAKGQVSRFYRRLGADLIYAGPQGLIGWEPLPASTVAGKAPPAPQPWREDAGQPTTDQPSSSLYGNFGLPVRALIELELSWTSKADFMVALGTDGTEAASKQAFRLEVWGEDLVVQRETDRQADVQSLQAVAAGNGRARFLLYLDQEQGRLLAFAPNGAQLANLRLPTDKPQVFPGITLSNVRGDLRLERLRIGRWDGVEPQAVRADQARLLRADGSVVYGELLAIDPATGQLTVLDGEQQTVVPLDQLSSVFVSPPREAQPPPLRIVFQDGSQVSGEPLRWEPGRLHLQCPGIASPLSVALADLRSLLVLQQQTPDKPAEAQGREGTLSLEGVRLRGYLVAGEEQADASCLVWQPIASATASPLRPGVAGRIVYREPAPPATAPPPPRPTVMRGGLLGAMTNLFGGSDRSRPETGRRSLHLRSGDAIPCKPVKIDEKGLTFETGLSDATFVPHDQIKALELIGSAVPLRLTRTKRERLLTLPRMMRDSPPTHLVRSVNGDFLRGRLIGMDHENVNIEVRLDNRQIARPRLSHIIWLHPDELGGVASVPPSAARTTATRVQAQHADGIRLTFLPHTMTEETLVGRSELLGNCRTQLAQVDQVLFGDEIEKAAARLPYHRWKLQKAVEPKVAQSEEGQPPAERTPGTESPLVGQPAPDFELELLDGQKYRLADHRGKIVVLDFWATWCGPCLQTMPQVEQVVGEFQQDGVELVAVNLEEAPKQIKPTLERHKLQLTVALDQDGAVAAKYSAMAIPQTVIIDRDGNIARLFVGGGPKFGEQLREALQALIAQDNSVARLGSRFVGR